MTTYTFNPTTLNFTLDWSSPAIWAGGVVPNSSDADVVFPVVYGNGFTQSYAVVVGSAYSIRSLAMNADYLDIKGALTVSQDIALNPGSEINMDGGSLNAGSVTIDGTDIQGPGQVQCTGSLVVDTAIVGEGLSVSAGALTNNGSLIAVSGNLTVAVTPGGFANMSGGMLTGGTYTAGYSGNTTANSEILYFNVGQTLSTDAAAIDLEGGGAIDFFDPSTQQYLPIQSTLQTIAAAGTLTLGANQSYSGGALTDYGSIILNGGTLSSTNLIVAAGAQLEGAGSVNSSLVDNGTILASYSTNLFTDQPQGQDLIINGSVSGSGNLEIGATTYIYSSGPLRPTTAIVSGMIEINGPAANAVVFEQGVGTLQLDQPASFTGQISAAGAIPASSTLPNGSSYDILLQGVSLASVTGYAYSGNSNSGTLTIQTSQGNYAYNFLGNYQTADFSLTAGPQPLSTLPPSLSIAVTPPGAHGLPTISGTSGPQTVSATETDRPFSGVTIGSGISTDILNLTVTLNSAGNGSLAPPAGAPLLVTNANYNAAAGVYSMSGTAAAVTQVLDSLLFAPNAGGLAPGQPETTRFSISVSDPDSAGSTPVVDSKTVVNAYSGITFAGGAHAALIIGGPGDDMLSAAAPQAFVYGDGGFDTITLAAGGAQTVELNAPGAYGGWSAGQGLDIINGFQSGSDRLAFDYRAYGVSPGSIQFLSGATPSTTAPTFYFDPGSDYLWFDPDGTGAQTPDLVAFLPGVTGLGAGDLSPAQISFQNGGNVVDQTPGTTAYGEGPNETLWATGPSETLQGGAYRGQFVAQAANDTVVSGAGGGFIAGLGGNDLLEAGAGADAFYFNSPANGVDTILDFNEAAGDKIVIQSSAFSAPSGFDFTDGVGFVQGPGAKPVAPTATFLYDTSTSYLWYDPGGTGPGGSSLLAFLPGSPSLHASDIQVA